MADSSILDGNRWPHWGQFCGLSTPARVDMWGGPPERLEPAFGCNSSARSINLYDISGLIFPWFYLASHFRIFPGVSRQNFVRVENAAIPLVPRIEKRAWTQVSVALRSAKVFFRRGPGHIRHTYIRMDKKLVWIRQPERNDDAARPVDPEKEPAPRRWTEFCSPGFPSATEDACGPRGSSGRIQKANVSDGVHSRQ